MPALMVTTLSKSLPVSVRFDRRDVLYTRLMPAVVARRTFCGGLIDEALLSAMIAGLELHLSTAICRWGVVDARRNVDVGVDKGVRGKGGSRVRRCCVSAYVREGGGETRKVIIVGQ
jgi:hypothetical protein